MLAEVSLGTGLTLATPPAGWQVLVDQNPDSTLRGSLFWKIAAAGEAGSSVSFNVTANRKAAGTLRVYSGVDPDTPCDATTTTANSGVAAGSRVVPSITT